MATVEFPYDPLNHVRTTVEYKRSVITGILESYNSNYDFLIESIQNAIDALEDAKLLELPGLYELEVTVNLKENSLAVLDTGVGMNADMLVNAFSPHVSYKTDPTIKKKRGTRNSYRGYKGIGLTFLSYGTDDVRMHSIRDKVLTKLHMQYGRAWADGKREDTAKIDRDTSASPLDKKARGTYLKVQFSNTTKPRSLTHLASTMEAWKVVIRTRTALGQVLLARDPVVPIKATLNFISTDGQEESCELTPSFLYPHQVEKKPQFRFLDVDDYISKRAGIVEVPSEMKRQDAMYLVWDTDKIVTHLTKEEKETYKEEIDLYKPILYAFVPYQGSIWTDINNALVGVKKREHLRPGLIIALNRQRLADQSELVVTRFETFGRNVMVILHFDNAKPDQGRKTVQEEVTGLAMAAANRAVQYLGANRTFLRPAGEAPTPGQREIERSHQDWEFNVRAHSNTGPLHIPPISYISTPLTEQDVVGLFHQFCAVGLFAGIKVYATSQIHTYDCLVQYDESTEDPSLRYVDIDDNPLGLSDFVLGDHDAFRTGNLTLEFKNNLDGLILDLDDPDGKKLFQRIDICVCWSTVSAKFKGYEITEITHKNLDLRAYPGVTHILSRDGDSHKIQVVMLKSIVSMIEAGQIILE